ncbi:MAG: MEKHLA domain-containing protein, partial [Microcoleaceae cyanobacterium]
MIDKNFSPWQAEEIIDHCQRLVSSFQYWTGKSLLANFSPIPKTPKAIAQQLFYAPFVLVSH